MSQMPTMQGYQPPQITQFSVFLDNKVGKLLEVLQILEEQSLQVVGVSILEAADHAVVRLISSSSNPTRQVLKKHGIPFSESEVLVVELRSGQTLAALCQVLLSAEINVYYAYPLLGRHNGSPAIVMQTDSQLTAGQALRRHQFTFLGEDDLLDDEQRGGFFDLPKN